MTIGVYGNATKGALPEAVASLLRFAAEYGVGVLLHEGLRPVLGPEVSGGAGRSYRTGEGLVSACDMIVAIGGDGTMLSAARMAGQSGVPILGINLGKLGFLAEVPPEEMEPFVRDIAERRFVVEERTVLRIESDGDPEGLYALNEAVIDKSSSMRVIHLSVHVDDEFLVSFQGDGIIVATPTGSTGYALAAGGPIIAPASRVIVLQPVSPHSLSARTVIVPDSSRIRITVSDRSDQARLTADGQTEKLIEPPASVTVRTADHTVRLVKRKERSYFDVLRAKLLWGSDIRLKGESGI